MELYFRCPHTGDEFATEEYALVHNRGIITTEDGERSLDAAVALASPCPCCGEYHRYAVSEISCPLTRGKSNE